MSAYRYCGGLRIRVTYVEPHYCNEASPNGAYRCHITTGVADALATTQTVIPPPFSRLQVNSPIAFDNAARAALAFAAGEGWPVDEHAALNDDGYVVSRKVQS